MWSCWLSERAQLAFSLVDIFALKQMSMGKLGRISHTSSPYQLQEVTGFISFVFEKLENSIGLWMFKR